MNGLSHLALFEEVNLSQFVLDLRYRSLFHWQQFNVSHPRQKNFLATIIGLLSLC
jgi:hypothetical protein